VEVVNSTSFLTAWQCERL